MSRDVNEKGWSSQGPVVELSDDFSWALLASKNVGHLALAAHGRPDIFPVNYYCDDRRILFRTGAGSKIRELAENAHVAFEVDTESEPDVWSVVALGTARVLNPDPVLSSEALSAFPPWVPIQPFVYVCIRPDSIRGRSFEHHLKVERL